MIDDGGCFYFHITKNDDDVMECSKKHSAAQISNHQSIYCCRVFAKEPARVWFWSFHPLDDGKTQSCVVCKAELPPKIREKTDFGLAQFVLIIKKKPIIGLHAPRSSRHTPHHHERIWTFLSIPQSGGER